MNVIGGIIAAGHGSRFKKAGLSMPKPLIEVNKRALLARTVDEFKIAGIKKIRIIFRAQLCERCSNFLHENFQEVNFEINCKDTETSCQSFLVLLSGLDQDEGILITTVDSIFERGSLKKFLDEIKRKKDFLLLGTTAFIDDEKPLYCELKENGQILSLGKKITDTVTCGAYYIPGRLVKKIRETGFPALRSFLSYALTLTPAFSVDLGKVIDVDRPEDLKLANKILAQREKNLL